MKFCLHSHTCLCHLCQLRLEVRDTLSSAIQLLGPVAQLLLTQFHGGATAFVFQVQPPPLSLERGVGGSSPLQLLAVRWDWA
eukprot:11350801-Alexandrium_andersonii.AAC.1